MKIKHRKIISKQLYQMRVNSTYNEDIDYILDSGDILAIIF